MFNITNFTVLNFTNFTNFTFLKLHYWCFSNENNFKKIEKFILCPKRDKMQNHIKNKIGPTKYTGEKVLDPRNTQEENFRTHEIPTKKILDPRNTHEGTMARWN